MGGGLGEAVAALVSGSMRARAGGEGAGARDVASLDAEEAAIASGRVPEADVVAVPLADGGGAAASVAVG